MYFPILRGKQFELIALRESSGLWNAGNIRVSPIIEPVKTSTRSLRMTLEEFISKNLPFNIIVNPIVGDFRNRSSEVVKFINTTLEEYDNFNIGIYIHNSTAIENIQRTINDLEVEYNGLLFIHNIPLEDGVEELNQFEAEFNLVDTNKTSRRYHRNFPNASIVTLDDPFNTLQRNVDYLAVEDEFFSEEHLYFSEDGFVGFSDYAVIGESYAESGFLPYAVAIHLTYADDENKIRIRHFVSDSNEDTTDVAGKFAEALDKLITWSERNEILKTDALHEFYELHRREHFPGLGYVKKLSIKHHLELVTYLLNNL